MATYGDPKTSADHRRRAANPDQPLRLHASWSIERALADYAHAYGLGYAALRYFNAAGASPDGDIGEDHTPKPT